MFKKLKIYFIGALLLMITSTSHISASKLEIFSWWTASGEKEGLETLFKIYYTHYPDTWIINAFISGGAGINAKLVLKSRMLSGNPPDSFQVHAGTELINTWVKSKYLKPITQLWLAENWFAVFPEEIIKMISYQGNIYSVPLNIHRSNLLWYNKEIFNKFKLSPPATYQEFLKIADTLQAAGITPLALASKHKWPVTHLLETILVETGGSQFYTDLIQGKLSWEDSRVIESLRKLKNMLKYTNPDHSRLSWDQACRLVLDGKAAMIVMGTWAQGFFTANGWYPDIDFGTILPFKNNGVFIIVCDTFGFPDKALHPENALNWLKVIASRKAQEKVNLKLGSIPARIDVPINNFSSISKQNMIDFRNSDLLPSIAHGSALIETFVSTINDELAVFINHLNPEETAFMLENKAKILGIR